MSLSLFSSFTKFFSREAPSATEDSFSLPFGLTEGEWRAMKTLPGDPGFGALVKVLDSLAKLDGERILQSSNAEALHFLRGHVAGLRKAATIIQEISLKEQEVEHERRRRTEAGGDGRGGRGVGLFGSPGWPRSG
jgi:hypothetical protein